MVPKSRRSSRKGKMSAPVWLKEGDDEDIVDLLEQKNVGKKLTASDPKEKKGPKDENRGFRTAKDGRLILVEDGEGEEGTGAKGKGNDDQEENLTEIVIGKKRKMNRKEDEDSRKKQKVEDMPFVENGYQPGGKGIHRPIPGKDYPGGKFKAKKGKGDTKKGQIEPYAYVPLDTKSLNRRKKSKVKGQFKSLVHGAKEGASKGSKGRKRKAQL